VIRLVAIGLLLVIFILMPSYGAYLVWNGNLIGFVLVIVAIALASMLVSAAFNQINEKEADNKGSGGGANSPIVTPEKIVVVKKKDGKTVEKREASTRKV